MLLIHVGPPELSVIRNRGVPLFRGSFYTLLYGLLAGTAANVRYREVSAIQGSVIEGFQCILSFRPRPSPFTLDVPAPCPGPCPDFTNPLLSFFLSSFFHLSSLRRASPVQSEPFELVSSQFFSARVEDVQRQGQKKKQDIFC